MMTSIELGNGLEKKSSMPRSDRQMFVGPSMLARGHGKIIIWAMYMPPKCRVLLLQGRLLIQRSSWEFYYYRWINW